MIVLAGSTWADAHLGAEHFDHGVFGHEAQFKQNDADTATMPVLIGQHLIELFFGQVPVGDQQFAECTPLQ